MENWNDATDGERRALYILTCYITLEVHQHGIPVGARIVYLRLLTAVVCGKHVRIQVLVQRWHFVAMEKQLKIHQGMLYFTKIHDYCFVHYHPQRINASLTTTAKFTTRYYLSIFIFFNGVIYFEASTI